MLILILSVLIAALLAWKYATSLWGDIYEWIMGAVLGMLAAGLFIVLSASVLNAVLHQNETTVDKPLAAIQDRSSTHGSFFLGSGTIDSKPQYTFYEEENGAKVLRSINADGVRVYEGAKHAFIREVTGCSWEYDWLVPCVANLRVVEIHVPNGTVKQNYVLDAQ